MNWEEIREASRKSGELVRKSSEPPTTSSLKSAAERAVNAGMPPTFVKAFLQASHDRRMKSDKPLISKK